MTASLLSLSSSASFALVSETDLFRAAGQKGSRPSQGKRSMHLLTSGREYISRPGPCPPSSAVPDSHRHSISPRSASVPVCVCVDNKKVSLESCNLHSLFFFFFFFLHFVVPTGNFNHGKFGVAFPSRKASCNRVALPKT